MVKISITLFKKTRKQEIETKTLDLIYCAHVFAVLTLEKSVGCRTPSALVSSMMEYCIG